MSGITVPTESVISSSQRYVPTGYGSAANGNNTLILPATGSTTVTGKSVDVSCSPDSRVAVATNVDPVKSIGVSTPFSSTRITLNGRVASIPYVVVTETPAAVRSTATWR